MADVIEVPAPAVDWLNNLTVTWCTGTPPSPLTAVAVKAGTRVTYSFVAGGWKVAQSQGTIKDPRESLLQDLEALDKLVVGVSMQYVDSTASGSAAVTLTAGTLGYFAERRNVRSQNDHLAAQVVRVIPCVLGSQLPDEQPTNGKFTISQTVALAGAVYTTALT